MRSALSGVIAALFIIMISGCGIKYGNGKFEASWSGWSEQNNRAEIQKIKIKQERV